MVDWATIAQRRPANGASPFDPAYRWADLDDFVRNAQQRGIEVLLTLWGTPRWANGGKNPNVPPTDPRTFGRFAHAGRAPRRRLVVAAPGREIPGIGVDRRAGDALALVVHRREIDHRQHHALGRRA